jgi:hypothetical protein
MLLGKRDQCPIAVGVWLSVPCVFSRLARSLVFRLRRNGTHSRNRKKRGQLLGHLHPLHLYLRRLQVGSNGGTPCKGAALSGAGAWRSRGGQPRRYHRSPRRSCEQPDRQEFRVDSSRRRGARADHESRAPSAAAGRYCRQRPVIRRTDPLRWALSAAPKLSLVRTCHRGDRGGMPRCSGFVRAAPDSMKAPDWTLLLRQVLSSANDPCGH